VVRKRGGGLFIIQGGHRSHHTVLGFNFYACPPGLYKFNYPYQPSEHHIPERKMAFLFRLVRSSCLHFFFFSRFLGLHPRQKTSPVSFGCVFFCLLRVGYIIL